MTRRSWALIAALGATVTVAVAQSPSGFPLPGEWPCSRRDGTQQARSPLRGHITTPAIRWQFSVASQRTVLQVEPGDSAAAFAVPAGLPGVNTGEPRWGLTPPLAAIAGQQQPLWHDSQTTYADVLPDVPGLEKIEFESGFAKPTVNGQWQSCVGRCFAWRGGKWDQVWQTDTIEMLFQADPLVGDFDGDGKLEIALLPWYELLLLDAATGQVKDRCKFTEGRSYGHFSAWDMDGDGHSEFLVQSDFAKHVDVLGWRAGKLALLWRRDCADNISNPQKIIWAHPHPVADVDGDRRREVCVNVFNDTADRRWRLQVCRGLTGQVLAELADEALQGVADLDGDGVPELLAAKTPGQGLPPAGTIEVWSLKGGAAKRLWSEDNAAWQTWEPPPPLNVNTAATLGLRDVMGRGALAVVRKPEGRRVTLSVRRWESGAFREVMAVAGEGLAGVALDASGCLLASASGARPTVSLGKARVTAATTETVAPPAGPVAIARERDGRITVVAQGADETLVAFRPPEGGQPARELWRVSGRAQNASWGSAGLGPVITDLAGDGARQVLYATAAPSGAARLVAMGLDGQEVWHSDFPAIPGSAPVWNTGGLILWQVGHFTDARRLDVALTMRRSLMHSEETAVLSGRDGHVLWQRNRQVSDRGVGGTPFAIADLDGDGRDDLASLHPSIIYLMKGSTGADLLARDATWEQVPSKPVYWGLPLAGDFTGSGRPSLFFATQRRSMTGVIETDGKLVWWDALDLSPSCLPAIGDMDGDGKLEAVGWGYADGVRCYATATGAVKWRLPAPTGALAVDMASGDVDGDGRDEVVVGAGTKLLCLKASNDGTAGAVAWTLDMPATIGAPALADVDGSGELAIVVAGADGNTYCVK